MDLIMQSSAQNIANATLSYANRQKEAKAPIRVYICVDVDSFFAQCDARKLGFDNSVPLVHSQWGLCVSVNYAARAFGAKNMMLVEEVKKLCPHVFVSHGDTFKAGEAFPDPYNTNIIDKFFDHNQNKEKVTLEYYRCEADRIFNILENYSNIVEKASFDEAFLDVTAETRKIYKEGKYRREWTGKLLGGEVFEPENEQDILLMIAAEMAETIRKDIEDNLNYTCSAGIAYNKMLSKLASGLNKPNGQATFCQKYTIDGLKPVNIEKIRNFGRLITKAFEGAGYTKLAQIHELNLQQIQDIVLDERTAKWVYFRARGFDDELVEPKEFASKSIMSSKNVQNINDMKELEVAIDLLLTELNVRLLKNYELNKTVPRTLNVHYWDNQTKKSRIKSVPINLKLKKDDFPKLLKQASMETIKSLLDCLYPCNNLSLSIKNFEKNDFQCFEYDISTYLKTKQRDSKETNPSTKKEITYTETLPIKKKVISGYESTPTWVNDTIQKCSITTKASSIKEEVIVSPQKQGMVEMKIEEKVECEKCGVLVNKSSLEGHIDFHTAEDLDKELNPNKKKYKKDSAKDSLFYKEVMSIEKKESTKKRLSESNEIIDYKKVKKTTPPLKLKEKEKQPKINTLERFFVKN